MTEVYIVSCEMFRVYKGFSICNRCNKPFKTPEEARGYMHSLVDVMDLKNIYDAVYVDTVSEDKMVVYVDDGTDLHVIHMIVTVNRCYTPDNKYFVYRSHFIEETPDGVIIGLLDEGPVTMTDSLDHALDIIDYIVVIRDNVSRTTGEFMMNTPPLNNRNMVS